jgi:hypothetical protein
MGMSQPPAFFSRPESLSIVDIAFIRAAAWGPTIKR